MVAKSFHSLKGLDTTALDDQGKRALVRVIRLLNEVARDSTGEWNPQYVGTSFSGLQGIRVTDLDDYGQQIVAHTLDILADKARACRRPISVRAVTEGFMGLRGFFKHAVANSPAISAAKALVAGLSDEPTASLADLRGLACALRAAHGAQALLSAEVESLWRQLSSSWASNAVADLSQESEEYLLAIVESEQVYALYDQALPVALTEAAERNRARCRRMYRANSSEREFKKLLSELLEVSVDTNQLVRGFELDLSFTVNGQLYNVELDGPTHGKFSQLLNDEQRDAYLRSAGYTVIRLPLQVPLNERVDKVLACVASA
jgi:very-short-patch-repair endonuclease